MCAYEFAAIPMFPSCNNYFRADGKRRLQNSNPPEDYRRLAARQEMRGWWCSMIEVNSDEKVENSTTGCTNVKYSLKQG
jgi:hypothetical protein